MRRARERMQTLNIILCFALIFSQLLPVVGNVQAADGLHDLGGGSVIDDVYGDDKGPSVIDNIYGKEDSKQPLPLLPLKATVTEQTYNNWSDLKAPTIYIDTVQDMVYLADYVNKGDGDRISLSFKGQTFILRSNLDFNDLSEERQNWTPIGSLGKSFQGTFDGGDKKISNLTINATSDNSGLFGYIEEATIQNLTVEDMKITSGYKNTGLIGCAVASGAGVTITNIHTTLSNPDNPGGYGIIKRDSPVTTSAAKDTEGTGGILGVGAGKVNILRCSNNLPIKKDNSSLKYMTAVGGIVGKGNENLRIEECSNTAPMEGTSDIGGIIGDGDKATITKSWNKGNISCSANEGNASNVGGIAGRRATIEECFNEGIIEMTSKGSKVGGIAGASDDIQASYNIGDVKYTGDTSNSLVGGIVGDGAGVTKSWNSGNVTSLTKRVGGIAGQAATIDKCYNLGDVQGNEEVGGTMGYGGKSSSTVIDCYNFGKLTGTSKVHGISPSTRVKTVTNSYYLSEQKEGTLGTDKKQVAFENGEVTWLLNTEGETTANRALWSLATVTIGEEPTATTVTVPVLADDDNKAVYRMLLEENHPQAGTIGSLQGEQGGNISDAIAVDSQPKETALYVLGGSPVILKAAFKAPNSSDTHVLLIESTEPEGLLAELPEEYPEGVSISDLSQDIKLVYQFASKIAKDEYTVTFDYNDGGETAPVEEVVPADTAVTKPIDPLHEGFDFVYWHVAGNDTAAYDFDAKVNQDFTLVAKWAPVSYKIEFDTRGGTPTAVDPITVAYNGSPQGKKPTDPARAGYLLKGWHEGKIVKDENDKDVVQLNAEPFDWTQPMKRMDLHKNPNTGQRELKLYAKWEGEAYEAVFHWNDMEQGGTETVTRTSVLNGEKLSDPSTQEGAPTKSGQKVWWYLQSDFSGGSWNFAEVVNQSMAKNKEIHLYAKWQPHIDADTAWFYNAAPGTTEFTLSTAAQMFGLYQIVNLDSPGNDFTGMRIQLAHDIDLQNTPWLPIGSAEKPFNGIFDGSAPSGDTFAIRGLNIDNPTMNYQALFGYIGSVGSIRNLQIHGQVKGNVYVAGVAAVVKAEIQGATVREAVYRVENHATVKAMGTGTSHVSGIVSVLEKGRAIQLSANHGQLRGTSSSNLSGIAYDVQAGAFIEDTVNYAALSVEIGEAGPKETVAQHIAGLVYQNEGTIIRGSNQGNLHVTDGSVAGIALANKKNGIIKEVGNLGEITKITKKETENAEGMAGIVVTNEGTVESSINSGAISGRVARGVAGGIAANNSAGIIRYSGNIGDITVAGLTVAGIVGTTSKSTSDGNKLFATVEQNYNRGRITNQQETIVERMENLDIYTGGIVGYMNAPENSICFNYNTGEIIAGTDSIKQKNAYIGGIIAKQGSSGTNLSIRNIIGNYNAADVPEVGTSNNKVGSLFGSITITNGTTLAYNFYEQRGAKGHGAALEEEAGKIIAKPVSGEGNMKTEAFVTEINDKLGKRYYAFDSSINGGYPVLGWEVGQPIIAVEQVVVIFRANDPLAKPSSLSKLVDKGTLVVPPDVKEFNRSGRRVANWSTVQNDPNTVFDFNTPITEAKELYAVWEEYQPKITYYKSWQPDSEQQELYLVQQYPITDKKGKETYDTAQPDALYQDGYQFDGWYELLQEKDKPKQLSATSYRFGKTIYHDLDLYAKWNDAKGDYSWYTNRTYEIKTVADLVGLANLVNGTAPAEIAGKAVDFEGVTIRLAENLDLQYIVNWQPIGRYRGEDLGWFAGTFDGQGHTIENLQINRSESELGLFGYVAGTVKNLTIANGAVQGDNGSVRMAALVGYLHGGTVENCVVGSNVHVQGKAKDGKSIGTVGGLVGDAQEYTKGTANPPIKRAVVIKDSNNLGTIGGAYAGGIAGSATAAHIHGMTMERVVNEGSITGNVAAGGIVGYGMGNAEIGYSYNVGSIQGNGTGVAGGLVGSLAGEAYLYNSFSKGQVSAGNQLGAVLGQKAEYSRVSNSYGLSGEWYDEEYATLVKAEQFEDGTVAYGLNKTVDGHKYRPVWTQPESGNHPVFASKNGGNAVYRAEIALSTLEDTKGTVVIAREHINAGSSAVVLVTPEAGHMATLVSAVRTTDGAKVDIDELAGDGSAEQYLFTMPQSDVIIQVLFKADPTAGGGAGGKIIVTFDPGEGVTEIPAQEINVKDRVAEPELPIRTDGAVFQYWYYLDENNQEVKFDFNTKLLESLTLYAKWKEPGMVTVTFDMNGGADYTQRPQEQIVPKGSFVTEPNPPVSKPGERFISWTRDQEGTQGWNFATDKAEADMTLYAQWNDSLFAGQGTEDNPFVLQSSADIALFADEVERGETFKDKTFVLEANITLDKPIGRAAGTTNTDPGSVKLGKTFSGVFDGRENTVTLNIQSDDQDAVGMFATLYGATVKNLTIAGQLKGKYFVGGVAGYTRDSKIIECTNKASIEGKKFVGGFVGKAGNMIFDHVSNQGIVQADGAPTSDHSPGVKVSHVGGIVGIADNVTVSNSQNVNAVTGKYKSVGGIVGTASNITIEHTHNMGKVAGDDDISGGRQYIGGIIGDISTTSTFVLTDVSNQAEVSSPKWSEVGGIAGNLTIGKTKGTIEDLSNTGNISGDTNVGGIIGKGDGRQWDEGSGTPTIYNLLTIGGAHNEGEINGKKHVGGIIGSTKYSEINQSKNIALIKGDENVGGILGSGAGKGTVQASYNLGKIVPNDGATNIGGIIGEVTDLNSNAQVKVSSSFSYESEEQNGKRVAVKPGASSIIGVDINGKQLGTVVNSYYSTGPSPMAFKNFGIGTVVATSFGNLTALSGATDTEGRSVEEFANGKVAYDLDGGGGSRLGVWGQNISGNPKDPHPLFVNKDGRPLIYLVKGSSSEGGSATVSPEGYVEDGATISVSADANNGYEAESLSAGNRNSKGDSFTVTADGDIEASATFKKLVPKPDPDPDPDPPINPGGGGGGGSLPEPEPEPIPVPVPIPPKPEPKPEIKPELKPGGKGTGDGTGIGDGSGSGIGSGEGDGIGHGEGDGVGNVGDGSGIAGVIPVDGTGDGQGDDDKTQTETDDMSIVLGEEQNADDEPLVVSQEQEAASSEGSQSQGGGGGSGDGDGERQPEVKIFSISTVTEAIKNNPILSSAIALSIISLLGWAAWRRYRLFKESIK